jgi:hypothetical protein
VCFLNTHEARIVKRTWQSNKISSNWFVERVFRMHNFFGNRWVEYKDQIDLMDCLSNMKIGLCWYFFKNQHEWTYDLMDHLIVNLEIIIALASMTYKVDLDAYLYVEYFQVCCKCTWFWVFMKCAPPGTCIVNLPTMKVSVGNLTLSAPKLNFNIHELRILFWSNL